MDPRLELLDGLRSELQLLLATLDGAKSGAAPDIDPSWRRCRRAFEEFRALDRDLRPPHTPYPAEVRERAAEVVRLHAIAEDLLRARLETVGGERRRLAKARAHLESLTDEGQTGRSCNVAG